MAAGIITPPVMHLKFSIVISVMSNLPNRELNAYMKDFRVEWEYLIRQVQTEMQKVQ